MCGVAGLLLGDSKATTAAVEIHESLYFLQHRGQDAAGITSCLNGRVYQCKGTGIASKVFDEGRRLEHLHGYMGLGHLRYPTAGTSSAFVPPMIPPMIPFSGPKKSDKLRSRSEAQPFYVNSPYGISMSVNGNLVNTTELCKFLDEEARRHINSDSDSELLLNIFAHGLQKLGKTRANSEDIFTALDGVYSMCQGAFACTAMIAGFGILGFRDANGIRPLCLGARPSTTLPGAMDYFMASESVALKQLGFGNIVDVLPGQAVFIEKGQAPVLRQVVARKSYTPDCFEMVYFARPESRIDGISVYRSRQYMGIKLAKRIKEVLGEQEIRDIDAVIPVPETSNIAAVSLANELGKPYVTALIKNRYVHRTFILPNQAMRQRSVRRKLSPIEAEFRGRNVIIVDDSLVRGTTSREIVQMAKEAGANRVIFVSCSPECTHPHIYGIDLADPADLIAHGKTRQEIAQYIQADDVIFQGLDDLKSACLEAAEGQIAVEDFEVGVFCGKYVTKVPEGYFAHLSDLRKAKGAVGKAEYSFIDTPQSQEDISLHNFGSDLVSHEK